MERWRISLKQPFHSKEKSTLKNSKYTPWKRAKRGPHTTSDISCHYSQKRIEANGDWCRIVNYVAVALHQIHVFWIVSCGWATRKHPVYSSFRWFGEPVLLNHHCVIYFSLPKRRRLGQHRPDCPRGSGLYWGLFRQLNQLKPAKQPDSTKFVGKC